MLMFSAQSSKVGINPILSDLNTPRTSKLGWMYYFEVNKNDKTELQIRKSSQRGTETNMAEKLSNFEFEKFERKKKSNFSPILNPET